VGFSWEDYNLVSEAKLLYDSFKLYILSFFNPKTPIVNKTIKSTLKDIDLIIEADKLSSKSNRFTHKDEGPTPKFNVLRNSYKISDGTDNSWDLYDVMTNPWVIFIVATAITITGVVVIIHYDLTLDQITEYSWTHIKTGFVATVTFIWKIIKWIYGPRGGDPRPPMSPSGRIPTNPDQLVNPALEINSNPVSYSTPNSTDNTQRPMVLTRSPIFETPDSVFNTPVPSPSAEPLPLYSNKGKSVHFGPETPLEALSESLQDELDTHHPNFNKIFMDNKDEIEKLNLEITTLEGAENTLQNLRLKNIAASRLAAIYRLLPKSISPASGGSITPTQSTSPLNTEGLSLPGITDNIMNE